MLNHSSGRCSRTRKKTLYFCVQRAVLHRIFNCSMISQSHMTFTELRPSFLCSFPPCSSSTPVLCLAVTWPTRCVSIMVISHAPSPSSLTRRGFSSGCYLPDTAALWRKSVHVARSLSFLSRFHSLTSGSRTVGCVH